MKKHYSPSTTQNIPFMKLSGAGNDFVIINNFERIVDSANAHFIKNFVTKVCERRMSVGADGVLLVEKIDHANNLPQKEIALDFQMRYFNADGGEAETCGNGARCISKFAYLNGIVANKMRFLTNAGVYESEIVNDNVKVGMSDPTDIQLNVQLQLADRVHTVGFVNTGVPHCVFFVDDLENTDVLSLGQQTRYHANFKPSGTNANFVHIQSPKKLDMRTYERGVENETLACGTGAVASAIISAQLGKVTPSVSVKTPGGVLKIHFNVLNGKPKNIYLEGDARVIYAGEIKPDAWNY